MPHRSGRRCAAARLYDRRRVGTLSSRASTGKRDVAASSARVPIRSPTHGSPRKSSSWRAVAPPCRTDVHGWRKLARTYDGADEWARVVLDDAREDDAPLPDTATIADAAFQLFAPRGASDYTP